MCWWSAPMRWEPWRSLSFICDTHDECLHLWIIERIRSSINSPIKSQHFILEGICNPLPSYFGCLLVRRSSANQPHLQIPALTFEWQSQNFVFIRPADSHIQTPSKSQPHLHLYQRLKRFLFKHLLQDLHLPCNSCPVLISETGLRPLEPDKQYEPWALTTN